MKHTIHQEWGGKANALHALRDAGFRVPEWFVVVAGERFDIAKLQTLGGALFAVRSSALAEDGVKHSFAGQFDTFLEVPAEEVAQRIDAVRDSARTERVLSYCRENQLPFPAEPAVIVQRMIAARSAGVAFSADPVSGHRQRVVISATEGTGEALVSGEVDGQGWVLDETDAVIRDGGTLVSLEKLREIAALARACEKHFGRAQDIEWALDRNGVLWLLQSRAITTLGLLPDPDDQVRVWDNSNIAESYCGVTTPMTFSFARRIYEAVYREFCGLLAVPKNRIAAADDVYAQMLGLIRGRVYYNLLSWYRVLAMLPGFRLNRGFMEQMMGVHEPLPKSLVEQVIAENRGGRMAEWVALSKTCLGLLRQWWGLEKQISAFDVRIRTALASSAISLERVSGDTLVAEYRGLERQLLKRWDAPLVNDFFAMIFYGVLGALCKKWLPDRGANFQNELLLDAGEMISAEPPRRMEAMADLLRTRREVATVLADAKLSIASKQQQIAAWPELETLYQAYLFEFGDRCMEELKLESATVRDDPSTLLQALGVMASREKAAPAEREAAPEIGLNGMRDMIFRFVLKHARARVLCRENLRFQRTLLFGRVRSLIREMGLRLVADGRLHQADDVFYLEIGELLGVWEGVNSSAQLAEIVALRQREFQEYEQSEAPPDRIMTHGPLHRYERFEVPAPHHGTAVQWQGTGACPGIVRGRARVVLDPRQASLESGEILIARQTDPGWVVLFPLAAGLLVERGSLLSHSAIVSREMRLPCIVSLPRITTLLQTGDLLEMNGSTGEIRLIADED
jgi:rifampicin phosphotransferase